MERNGFKIGQLVVNNVIKNDESEFLKSKAAQQEDTSIYMKSLQM